MNGNIDKNFIDSAIKASGGKLSAEDIKNATQKGDASPILKNLSEQDRNKINKLLNDKASLAALLKSPQAVEIMKKLSGGGKNG